VKASLAFGLLSGSPAYRTESPHKSGAAISPSAPSLARYLRNIAVPAALHQALHKPKPSSAALATTPKRLAKRGSGGPGDEADSNSRPARAKTRQHNRPPPLSPHDFARVDALRRGASDFQRAFGGRANRALRQHLRAGGVGPADPRLPPFSDLRAAYNAYVVYRSTGRVPAPPPPPAAPPIYPPDDQRQTSASAAPAGLSSGEGQDAQRMADATVRAQANEFRRLYGGPARASLRARLNAALRADGEGNSAGTSDHGSSDTGSGLSRSSSSKDGANRGGNGGGGVEGNGGGGGGGDGGFTPAELARYRTLRDAYNTYSNAYQKRQRQARAELRALHDQFEREYLAGSGARSQPYDVSSGDLTAAAGDPADTATEATKVGTEAPRAEYERLRVAWEEYRAKYGSRDAPEDDARRRRTAVVAAAAAAYDPELEALRNAANEYQRTYLAPRKRAVKQRLEAGGGSPEEREHWQRGRAAYNAYQQRLQQQQRQRTEFGLAPRRRRRPALPVASTSLGDRGGKGADSRGSVGDADPDGGGGGGADVNDVSALRSRLAELRREYHEYRNRRLYDRAKRAEYLAAARDAADGRARQVEVDRLRRANNEFLRLRKRLRRVTEEQRRQAEALAAGWGDFGDLNTPVPVSSSSAASASSSSLLEPGWDDMPRSGEVSQANAERGKNGGTKGQSADATTDGEDFDENVVDGGNALFQISTDARRSAQAMLPGISHRAAVAVDALKNVAGNLVGGVKSFSSARASAPFSLNGVRRSAGTRARIQAFSH
jgi:hypothetical protein